LAGHDESLTHDKTLAPVRLQEITRDAARDRARDGLIFHARSSPSFARSRTARRIARVAPTTPHCTRVVVVVVVMPFAIASSARARVSVRAPVSARRARRVVTRASTAEENAADAQRWIDNWKAGGARSGANASADGASGPFDATRAPRDGELSIKRGLFSTFIREGEVEVSAEKYKAFQAEIAAKKAAAKKRQEEARANKKGPFGLW